MPMGHCCAPEIQQILTGVVAGDPKYTKDSIMTESSLKNGNIDIYIDGIRYTGAQHQCKLYENWLETRAKKLNATFKEEEVLHEFAPSNAGRSGAQLMRDAIKRKHATYVKTGLIPFEQFKCIPMLSGGALHSGTKILLNSLADVCGLSREFVIHDLALRLQELNGSIALSQLRRFPRSDEESAF